MSKRNWNIGIIRLFNDAIYNEGLSTETQGLTNGLRYHLIDICVDELAKVNRNAALPLTEVTTWIVRLPTRPGSRRLDGRS